MNKVSLLIVLLMSTGLVQANEAVSDLNGKLSYSTGSMESDEGHNVAGSFSGPALENWGFQADGLYANVSDRDFSGAGAHLFRRDPDLGLLGLTGGFVRTSVVDSGWAGLEAERYMGKLTLTLGAGVATIDYDDSAPFIDASVTDFYASMGLRYYLWDDLMLSSSYSHIFDNGLVQAELEYQTSIDGLALFAELAAGEHDYDHALLGLRFYFGKAKSLKGRHRRDDPPNIASQIFRGIGTYGAEYNQRGRAHAATHNSGQTYTNYGAVSVSARITEVETIPADPD